MFVYLVPLISTLILPPQEEADKFICRQGDVGGGGGCTRPTQDTEWSLMVKDPYQLFMCIVVYVYN
jgi:hypothetical protein